MHSISKRDHTILLNILESIDKIIEFTLIYNQHKSKLFNYALKMIGDRMSCEDIIQNVFVKFFENLESIKNTDSFNFWLFKTTRNEIFSYYRKKKTDCLADS